jgi:Polyketide cyclase / dehydrase and lipid transport
MTEYALEGAVEIGASGDEILRWLGQPELMRRWMGVSSVEASGTGIRVEVSHGAYAGWTYIGEITERGEDRLVRRYRLAGSHEDDYERTVTYELTSTGRNGVRLGVTVVTLIPGLDDRAARMGAKAENRALDRSLGRLRDAVEGRGGVC